MTVVSNDPILWPIINSYIFASYWIVAAGVVVVYDWLLSLGQEIELIWVSDRVPYQRQRRWSLMTVLYLAIRYIGISYSIVNIMGNMSLVLLTDAGCNILDYIINGTSVVVTAMLGVIMIARLHAMYQRSRMMLIFLVIIFLVINIACGVIAIIALKDAVAKELILSGTHICDFRFDEDTQLLFSIIWTLNTVWEVLTLCLSVWITVVHFRDLQRLGPSAGSTIEDSFKVLIKSHVFYFACFVCVSCLALGDLSPELMKSNSMGSRMLYGALQILVGVQMFVLGPRLILSIREYHVKLVADSDAETSMNSIIFQERVHVPTSSIV